MKAATERKLIRWFHIVASVPILSYIYGPVASLSQPAFAVIFYPASDCLIWVLAVARSSREKVGAHRVRLTR